MTAQKSIIPYDGTELCQAGIYSATLKANLNARAIMLKIGTCYSKREIHIAANDAIAHVVVGRQVNTIQKNGVL